RTIADACDVADEDTAKARSECGGVVANLVGVREDDVVGSFGGDELLEGGDVAVGCVGGEERMLDADDIGDVPGGGLGGKGFGLRADDDGCWFGAGLRSEDVGCCDGFKADPAETTVAIFKN